MTTENKTNDDLKPCPFCGGEAKLYESNPEFACCSNAKCPAHEIVSYFHEWNTRAAQPQPADKQEALDATKRISAYIRSQGHEFLSHSDNPNHDVEIIKEALTAPQPVAGVDVVPGAMRCAKCNFRLQRNNMYMQSGTIGPGDNKTEPCPNGCGPLWPVTWKEDALESDKRLIELWEENQQLKESARLYAKGQTAQPATGECPNSGKPCSCSNDDNCVTRESASDGTINKTVKPDEDAQRALDYFEVIWRQAEGVDLELNKYIRAALARGLGE